MGLFKRKSVPAELPELALDDLESGTNEVHNHLKEEEKKSSPVQEVPKSPPEKNVSVTKSAEIPAKQDSVPEVKKEEVPDEEKKITPHEKPRTPIAEEEKKPEKSISLSADKSFFKDLQNDLTSEISDFKQFEEWYKNKFEKRDVIKEMKSYWEDQKTTSIIKILGKNFQEKISKKISALQGLEKSWQKTYFELVEKEEEIKEQELELKELLSEFVKICKNRTDNPGKVSSMTEKVKAESPVKSKKAPVSKDSKSPKTSK